MWSEPPDVSTAAGVVVARWFYGAFCHSPGQVGASAFYHSPVLFMIGHHYTENGAVEPSYSPDFALEIDSVVDQIAQMFKDGGASRVAHWHLCIVETESRSAVANRMKQIVAFLFQPCRNIREKIAGLMFSSELATTINGVRNMTGWARKNGYSRALVSHYSRQWDKTFGYKISQAFGKSPEACLKYREARLRYLSKAAKHE